MSAERSGTFWPFWRLMRDLYDAGRRPPIIVLENVVGLLYGHDFVGLCEALAAIGMKFGAVVIDARHFVAQSRPRVFVVAVDLSVETAGFSLGGPIQSPWFPKVLLSVYERLPADLKALWRWWKVPVPASSPRPLSSIIEEKPSSVEWNSDAQTDYLVGMMSPASRERLNRLVESGTPAVGMLYRRMRNGKQTAEVRFDGLAGCLRTPRGGSSRQTVVVVGPDGIRSRLLSPREAARLMGVDDGFRLPERYNDAYLAMGDAVAVPVVRWLSESLLQPLARLSAEGSSRTIKPGNTRIGVHRHRTEERLADWGGGQ